MVREREVDVYSPIRSLAAVSVGVGLHTQVLGRLAQLALQVLMPAEFPPQPDPETYVVPTTLGLAAMSAASFANAALSGLVAGRIGRFRPDLHGLALAGALGFLGSLAMAQLRGFPGWFAIGFVVLPSLGAALGGWLAARRQRRVSAPR